MICAASSNWVGSSPRATSLSIPRVNYHFHAWCGTAVDPTGGLTIAIFGTGPTFGRQRPVKTGTTATTGSSWYIQILLRLSTIPRKIGCQVALGCQTRASASSLYCKLRRDDKNLSLPLQVFLKRVTNRFTCTLYCFFNLFHWYLKCFRFHLA